MENQMSQIPNFNPFNPFGEMVKKAEALASCISPGNRNSGAPGGVYSEVDVGDVVETTLKTYRRGAVSGVLTRFKKYGVARSGFDILIPVEVASYVDSMMEAAAKEGVTLQITSGFRTMEYQQYLKKTLGNTAATPGYSPHQVGYAVDFSSRGRGQYEWMVKNAFRYGFVRTVPNERWHWEYRGTWPGQTRPQWAAPTARSMFQFVAANHTCGKRPGGGKYKIKPEYWYKKGGQHLDEVTRGATNSWTGPDGSYLPDKFDRESPGWDTT